MKFTKMHGCGNDYVYVDCTKAMISDPADVARKVSDRHFGVGSDGLILICPSQQADFRMAMFNADGSEGAMCGNGIRCVAKFVYDKGLTDKTRITVETRAGIKTLDLTVEDGKVSLVRVDMGLPNCNTEAIPVRGMGDFVVGRHVNVAGQDWVMTCVSMGNPHAVVWVDEVAGLPLEQLGPTRSICGCGSGAAARPWPAAPAPAPAWRQPTSTGAPAATCWSTCGGATCALRSGTTDTCT